MLILSGDRLVQILSCLVKGKPRNLSERMVALLSCSGVDIALLTAAAKALRDVGVLDKQLLRAREVSCHALLQCPQFTCSTRV